MALASLFIAGVSLMIMLGATTGYVVPYVRVIINTISKFFTMDVIVLASYLDVYDAPNT